MSNASATSERLQLQQLRSAESDPEEEYVLVYFQDERSYSIVTPEFISESDFRRLNDIHVYWGKGKHSKLYPAKVIFYGTEKECEEELAGITQICDENSRKRSREKTSDIKEIPAKKGKETTKSGRKQQELEEEQQKLKKTLVEKDDTRKSQFRLISPIRKPEIDTDAVQHSLSDIVNRLQVIESKIDKLGQVMKYNTPSTSQQHDSLGAGPSQLGNNGKSKVKQLQVNLQEQDDNTEEDDVIEHDLVYNGIDLLALKGPTKEPTRYATRVAGILFSHDELLTGMIPPLSERTKKVEFNPEKVSMLKRCIARKYSDKILQKYWPDIRRSVNQKGNDLRKKQPKVLLVGPLESSNDATNPDEAATLD